MDELLAAQAAYDAPTEQVVGQDSTQASRDARSLNFDPAALVATDLQKHVRHARSSGNRRPRGWMTSQLVDDDLERRQADQLGATAGGVAAQQYEASMEFTTTCGRNRLKK